MKRLELGVIMTGFVSALAWPAAAWADDLNLICFGQGEKLGSRSTNELVWDEDERRYRYRDSIRTEMQGFDTAVTIQIHSGTGRIRLPQKLIPPLHGGGDQDNWWALANLQMSDNEISASYRLNGLNQPKVKIDRTSGMITIKGFGQDFSGRCDPIDAGQKRF